MVLVALVVLRPERTFGDGVQAGLMAGRRHRRLGDKRRESPSAGTILQFGVEGSAGKLAAKDQLLFDLRVSGAVHLALHIASEAAVQCRVGVTAPRRGPPLAIGIETGIQWLRLRVWAVHVAPAVEMRLAALRERVGRSGHIDVYGCSERGTHAAPSSTPSLGNLL